ncbi:hypothetical protein ACV566_12875 [Staphylococcus aureus]
MIFGILGGHAYGFENYTKGQAPVVGGISGFLERCIISCRIFGWWYRR